MKKLIAYRLNDHAPRMVPAVSERAWMSETQFRFAYRCLPLTIANSMGWEVLCPVPIVAEWNGGVETGDIEIETAGGRESNWIAQSHFGHGVLTFQLHHLFRTESGIGLWVRGSPNLPKDGICPLEGIVETDWLNFTFTMNWKFTRPGRISFDKDEPFCFLTPLDYHGLDEVEPEIVPMDANAELATAFHDYEDKRQEFIEKLEAGDPETLRTGWQKWYMRGVQPSGEVGNSAHLSKLRVAAPKAAAAVGAPGPAEGSPTEADAVAPAGKSIRPRSD